MKSKETTTLVVDCAPGAGSVQPGTRAAGRDVGGTQRLPRLPQMQKLASVPPPRSQVRVRPGEGLQAGRSPQGVDPLPQLRGVHGLDRVTPERIGWSVKGTDTDASTVTVNACVALGPPGSVAVSVAVARIVAGPSLTAASVTDAPIR